MQKTKGWLRFRHRIVRNLAYLVLYPYSRIRYGIRIEKCPDSKGRQFLILLNHQTPFDQFFTGMAFKGAVYYLATEDIFSMGWVSGLIRWLINPIPIKTAMNMLGMEAGPFRLPLCEMAEGNQAALRKLLQEAGLLA